MISTRASAAAQRDRGLERLRHLTVAVGVCAAGLAAVLSLVAAWSIPGQANSGASNQGTTLGGGQDQTQAQSLNQGQPAQNPFAGLLGGGGGGNPVAVSGGSHP